MPKLDVRLVQIKSPIRLEVGATIVKSFLISWGWK